MKKLMLMLLLAGSIQAIYAQTTEKVFTTDYYSIFYR